MIYLAIVVKSRLHISPHPQPFSLGEKGARFKVPLPLKEGFRVREDVSPK
jgi:hypothetical protein